MKLLPISSLRARLVALVLFAAVPAFILLAWSAANARDQAAREAREDAARAVAAAARNQAALIDQAQRLLMLLAQVPQTLPGHESECSSLARAYSSRARNSAISAWLLPMGISTAGLRPWPPP